MEKVSKTQQAILDKMAKGWELGHDSLTGSAIQKGGIGRGGQSEIVSISTVRALLKKGLIVKGSFRFPTMTYKLAKEKE